MHYLKERRIKMFEVDKDKYDQHFLIDTNVINNFIEKCNLKKEDIILEIGPGVGVLTKLIVPKVKKLYVIEKDIRLKKYLDKIDGIDIIYNDCLKTTFPKVDKIITSLPYSIIEPFIYKIVKEDFKELYLIMGKKYIDNITNNKITNLSLLTNIYFNIERYFDIYPESFNPKPRVMSSAVRLSFKNTYTKKELLFQNMYKLDNKIVKNSLLESLIKINNLTKREAKEIIKSYNIPDNILNKKFNMITNKELNELYNTIKL